MSDYEIMKKITAFYDDLYELRRVPPPETLVSLYINYLTKGRCFMCFIKGLEKDRHSHLVDDHDHMTGMERARLCKSCNTIEGKTDSDLWNVYRLFAPNNGLYIPYQGYGEQWTPKIIQEYGVPFPNRLKLKDFCNATDEDLLLKDDDYLLSIMDKYFKHTKNLPATNIPKTATIIFDLQDQFKYPFPLGTTLQQVQLLYKLRAKYKSIRY